MKLTLFVGATLIHSTVSAYSITGNGVNCRSGPGTSYDVKKMYAKGHDVSISCQASGPNIKGDAIWDKTSDGCYVADYYVKTGSSGYVVAKCSGGAEGSGGSGGGSGGCGAPSANAATVDLIAGFEGWVDHVYTDATGHPTIGYGHLCSSSACNGVGYPIPMSKDNGKKLLAKDMGVAEKCITAMTTAKLNGNQYGALVSWTFNLGCGAAKSSTLMKRLNGGESPGTVISEELPKWVNGNGKVLPGLVSRRKAEIELSKKATGDEALPAKC